MFRRNVTALLEAALKRAPVVLLNGARQVGKTTLVTELADHHSRKYITFDDEITLLSAKENPSGFIMNLEKPVIIDEVQRVPEIFLSIKRDVDKNRKPGMYLLTGSANPLLLPQLGDSLLGRMEVIDLMPLSQGEILGIKEDFVDTIFSNAQLEDPKVALTRHQLYEILNTGGYPAVQSMNEADWEAWMRAYVNLFIKRDIKELARIEKIVQVPNLFKVLAARSSGLLNVADMARDSKMNNMTLHRYLALFETLFMIYQIPAWSNNMTTRLVKSAKIFLNDSGLLCYLLDTNIERLVRDSVSSGKILENFVISELKKQITWSKLMPAIYHFRAGTGHEVDIVLERRSGDIVGIEIKHSERVTHDDFSGLRFLQEKTNDKFRRGIVLYAGSQIVPFGDGLYAVPIQSLWQQHQ